MNRQFTVPLSRGASYLNHRSDYQALTGDIVEALLLDLFDYLTCSSREYDRNPNNPIWINFETSDFRRHLKIDALTDKEIEARVQSLHDKRFITIACKPECEKPYFFVFNHNFVYQELTNMFGSIYAN